MKQEHIIIIYENAELLQNPLATNRTFAYVFLFLNISHRILFCKHHILCKHKLEDAGITLHFSTYALIFILDYNLENIIVFNNNSFKYLYFISRLHVSRQNVKGILLDATSVIPPLG